MVRLPAKLVKQIIDRALASPAQEICGLIGTDNHNRYSHYPVRNIASTPKTRFELAPAEQIDAMRDMREKHERLHTIYHSHPNSAPTPSETDKALATYPEAYYLIISLEDPHIPLVKAYRWDENDFIETGMESLEE